jgi:hypothetical protein
MRCAGRLRHRGAAPQRFARAACCSSWSTPAGFDETYAQAPLRWHQKRHGCVVSACQSLQQLKP